MTQKTKDGVDSKVFRGVLTTLGDSANFKVVKMRKFDYDRIMNHLYKGGALILGHYEIPQEGVDDYEPHYSFWVDGDEEDSIHGINVLRKPAATVNSFSSVVLYGMESRTMEYLNEPMEIFLLTRKDLYV